MLIWRIAWHATLMVSLYSGFLHAQNFPVKPIRVVTGAVGGAPDIVGRLMAPVLGSNMGQQVIIENRGGASGTLATQAVSKAPPDGHTLLFYASALWLVPLMREVQWDAVKDFAPITLVASTPNILVVHPSLPVTTVEALIALAKARPGTLNYAVPGAGASPHLAAELFRSRTGVSMVPILYKGGGPAVADLVGGQVHLMFPSAASAMPYVRSGRLRALGVTSPKPSALAPELPTLAASGLPGFVTQGLYPIFAPAGTPTAIINRLHQEILRVIRLADMREKLLSAGVEPAGSTPDELAALLQSEIETWGRVIRQAGIRE